MPRVLTICHPLEGIGRTTLTVQLAAAAAAQGVSVLVIDAAPDAAATRMLTCHRPPAPEAVPEVGEGIVAAAWAGVDLVPAEHVSARLVAAGFADPSALPRAVARWGQGYALVLIDTPAGVGPLLLAAAAAADALVLPTTATRQAVAEVRPLLDTLTRYGARAPVVAGVVLTGTRAVQDAAGHYWTGYLWQTCEAAAAPLCQPSLPHADALDRAAARGCPVAELDTPEAQTLAGLFARYLGQLAPGLAHP